jgi:hypothetical protein
MKKFYIFLSSVAMISSAFSQAQMSLPAGATFGPSVKTSRSNVFIDNDTKTGTLAKPKSKVVSGRGANLSSFVRIGSTYYDLQSNYATAHRVVMHKDQAISAAWTTSYSGAQGFLVVVLVTTSEQLLVFGVKVTLLVLKMLELVGLVLVFCQMAMFLPLVTMQLTVVFI